MCTSRSAAIARSRASLRLAFRSANTSSTWRADAQRGIQRRAGVLVDHRDAVAPVEPERLASQREDVAARDLERAVHHAPVARQVADDRERDGRLAAARLADEAVARALLDGQRDPADDLPIATAHAVDELEVAERERRGRDIGLESGSGAHSSSTCWTESAIRLIATTSVAIASAGKTTAHQASEMSAYCSAICSPQSGEGGCGP